MLYKETVDSTTLELLNSLQSKPYLKGFYLVGGTALALKLGHRKSVDLDLFSNFNFDVEQLLENLSADFNDIDFSDWPEIISEPELKWETVKSKLESSVKKYIKEKL